MVIRWCGRYGLPLVLVGIGYWLWGLGVSTFDAPVVIQGLIPSAVAVDRVGNLYATDIQSSCVWKVDRWSRVERFAGTGENNYGGDGGKATKASLAYPVDIVFDAEGNLYVADGFNHRVRKVDKAGIVTTVAGSGEEGYSGDGGKAVKAKMTYPAGIAVDAEGNLYIADQFNHRIRRVDKAGIITTVAGIGQYSDRGDRGKAVKAGLAEPSDVAADAEGNLYIADYWNGCVRKVNEAGVITTVVRREEVSGPDGISVDSQGNLYIVESSANRISKMDKSGVVKVVAGSGREGYSGDGGKAVKARLRGVGHIAADTEGNLYIADWDNHCVRRVNQAGIITTVIAGKSRFGR